MAHKRERQTAIREIVETRPVGSQEELRKLLRQRGWDVTQATLSRDLRDLRLARVPTVDGVRYTVLDDVPEESRATLETLLPPLFVRIEGVSELAVLKLVPGGAQPIAVALDNAPGPDILGTIAGDDTILIICRSSAARERVVRRLEGIGRETASP